MYYFIYLNYQYFQTNSFGTPIHNHNKKQFLGVFTTFDQNNVIIRGTYTGNQYFSTIRSYIILFITTINIFTPISLKKNLPLK
jgi:hypothetical protein